MLSSKGFRFAEVGLPSPSCRMGSKPRNSVVKEAFKACQDSFAIHPKLVKRLRKFYGETDVDRFFESFMYYLKFPISGYVER